MTSIPKLTMMVAEIGRIGGMVDGRVIILRCMWYGHTSVGLSFPDADDREKLNKCATDA